MPDGRFEAALFDFGGVLTTSPVENFAAYERARGLPANFIGGVIKANLHQGAFARFERGEISLEAFCAGFASETRAAGHEIGGAEFLTLLEVSPRPEMISALARVKAAGLKTGCITNNFPARGGVSGRSGAFGDPALVEALGYFDEIIESSKAGVRKPEPRIYELMCEALAVRPEACVFIDDLGVNLKTARAMGMHTIKAPLGDSGPALRALSEAVGIDLL